jgi:hypothetical protein
MSEVLGDTDPDDDTIDEDEFEDELDRAIAASSWSATLTNPVTLGIAALALAIISLIGLLSTYLVVNAVGVAHPAKDAIFGVRITAFVELGLAVIAVVLAFLAHSAARIDPDLPAHRAARWMAGAALLLGLVSIIESVSALLILIGAHVPTATGG